MSAIIRALQGSLTIQVDHWKLSETISWSIDLEEGIDPSTGMAEDIFPSTGMANINMVENIDPEQTLMSRVKPPDL